MNKFKATIDIIGINPFVFVPARVLSKIFQAADKDKGHIPIKGTVNNVPFKQTLLRYKGEWRLYISNIMLSNSPKRIGEVIEVSVEFDAADRTIAMHPKLKSALRKDTVAKKVFDSMPPSRQKEVIRYIANLKTEESIEKNVKRAIDFLNGKGSFVGRTEP